MNNYDKIGDKYNDLGKNIRPNHSFFKYYTGTTALVSRDLPLILSKFNPKKKILDFGCGTGISTRLLKSTHHDVIGVDINNTVLKIAKNNDPLGTYIKISKNGPLPFNDHSFSMIVSVFVLSELPSINKLIECFNKIIRILENKGIFIAVVNTEELYQYHNWLSLDTNYLENLNLKSGDFCKVKLIDINLELVDYYWTDNDYVNSANKAGFEIVKKHRLLGKVEDDVEWKDEYFVAPCVIYVFRKSI